MKTTNEIKSALYDCPTEIGKRANYLLQNERLWIESAPEYLCVNFPTYAKIGRREIAAAKKIAAYICKFWNGLVFFGCNVIAYNGKLTYLWT